MIEAIEGERDRVFTPKAPIKSFVLAIARNEPELPAIAD
jgi:hypothetical protein